jgi:hypothetical protein
MVFTQFGVRTSLSTTALVCNVKTLIIPSFASSKSMVIERDIEFRRRIIEGIQRLDCVQREIMGESKDT